MPKIITLAIIIIIGTLFVLYIPDQAHACSCIASSEAEYFQRADMVFIGIPTEIDSSDDYRNKVTFDIQKPLKGVPNDTSEITAMTGKGDSDCGYNFQIGLPYKIHISEGFGSKTYTGLCSGNQLVSENNIITTEYSQIIFPLIIGIVVIVGIGISTYYIIFNKKIKK